MRWGGGGLKMKLTMNEETLYDVVECSYLGRKIPKMWEKCKGKEKQYSPWKNNIKNIISFFVS